MKTLKTIVGCALTAASCVFALAAQAAEKSVKWSLPANWEEGVAYDEVGKIGGGGQQYVDIHGGDLHRRYGLGAVGEPDLPTYTTRIELPKGGTFVSATLAEVEWEEVAVTTNRQIPSPIAEWVRYGEELVYPEPDAAAYAGVYPSEFVVAGTPDVYRGVTRVPITVTPYKWDGTTRTLYRASRLRVQVEVEVKRTLKLTTSSTSNLQPQIIIVSPHDFVNHWNGYAAFRKSTEAGKDFEFIVKDTRTIYSDSKYWTKHCEESWGVERDDNADALAIHHYLEDVYDANRVQYIILGAAPTKYQYDRDSMIPARYVVNGGSYGGMVCDLYYGCMDRRDADGNVIQKSAITEDSPEVWDYNCDGYYMGTKTASGYSNDPDKCVDWTMDVPVTRVPMMREYAENLNNTWYHETADDIMRHFTNNIAYAENPATWTRDKRWQHVIGGGYLFNYYDRGSDNEMVQGEHAFFDGGPNYFDPVHKSPAPDAETCPRQRHYQYFSRYRASRLALINTGGYVNTEFDDLYRNYGDVFTSQSHGLQRGSDPGRTHGALAATGIWRVFNMALPCDTGWYDYCPGGSYGITNCCCMGEAPLLCFNDNAGGLVTFNNSRYAYWGGFDGASSKMEGLLDKALYELDMNTGDACRYMHNNCGYTGGGQAGWVNLEVIMHGDPLIRLSPQYSRTWNATSPNYTWSSNAAAWTIEGLSGSQTLDYSKDLRVNASGKGSQTFTIPDTDEDVSAARLTIAGDKNQTITLGGAGQFRVTDSTVITNANLVWNVAGGAGRNGIEFVGDPCDLTFEGNAVRYVGSKIRNVRNLNVSGLNVTLDSDRNQTAATDFDVQAFGFVGDNDLSEGAYGDYNVIRARVQGYFPDTMTIPVVNSRLELQTYNVGGADDSRWQDPLFYLTNAYLRVSYNPYWKSEYFVRPTYLNNGHLVGAYAQFGFGRPGSGSAAAKGYDLYVWGNSSIEGDTPIMITGELRVHLMSADAVLEISNPMANGHAGATGSIRVMGSGKVRITGETTFTGAITVENGAKLELAIAKAVKCDVDVAANCELHLDQIPLDGVTTLALASGSKTYLPQPTGSGIYQIVDPSTASVESENGAVFYDARWPLVPLSGVVSEGYFILSDGLRKWNGTTGTWQNDITKTANWRDGSGNPAGFTNTMPVVFGVQASGSGATVTVSGEVKPGFVSFENAGFPYTFNGSGTVTADSLSSGHEVTFNAALNVDTILKVTGGKLKARTLKTPLVEISNGGKLHVTDAITEAEQKIKAIRFSFAEAKSSSEKTAIQEVRLFRAGGYGYNDVFVPLPAGTIIEDCAGQKIEIWANDGYEHYYTWLSSPVPTKEDESLKALIDGIDTGYNNNKWWASASSAPTWFTITFPSPVDPIPGYALCAADSAGRNPKTWSVLTSADGTTFATAGTVTDFPSEKGNTWLAYDYDYGTGEKSNFGINSVAGSLTVHDGGTLYLQGALAHNLILEAGAHLAVTGDEYLQKASGSVAQLTMPDEGIVWVDSNEAKASVNEEPILFGYNLTVEQFAKFRCTSDTATLRFVDGNLYIISTGVKKAPYTATLASASGTKDWSALDWKDGDNNSFTWNNSTAYRADGEATINFNGSGAATTINLDVPGLLGKLHVAGNATDAITLQWGALLVPNTLVFSNYAGSVALNYGAGDQYALESANFVAGHDTDIPYASSGTLYIGPGMRALVPEWDYANVSGAGTLAIKRATRATAVDKATWANDNPVLTNELYQGTWEIKNQNDYPKEKEVRVGANGLLKFTTVNDATGYSTYTTGLTIADGGEVNVAKRDTFNRKLTLENGGKLTFTQDASDNGRIYDFYVSSSLNVTGLATSAIGGSNATADSDTHDPIVNSGIVALRRDAFPVTVAAGAALNVFAQWGENSSKNNSWIKQGGGLVAFHRATVQSGALTISAGAVRLVNKGQATTGPIVNQAELQLLASNNYEQTVANAISGAGRLVKKGPGTSVLTGETAYTGGTTVESGTLRVAANRLQGALTLNAGATIDITGEEGLDEYVITTGTFVNGGGTVQLNGTALPAGGYKVSDNKIVRSEKPDPNEMYHNQLCSSNEQVMVSHGTYGSIEVPEAGYYATAFNALTKLNTSGTGIGGSYTNIIKDGTYIATHTVVGWFKVDTLPTGASLATLYLAKSCDNAQNGYKVAVDASGKILVGKISYDNGNYSWYGSNYKTTSSVVVTAGKWFHLAIAITKTDGAKTVTPAVFANGQSVAITSGTFEGNLNGNKCTDLMVGAGVTASGVYVDTTALSDAAKVASFATNEYYLVRGQEQSGAAAIGGTTYPTLAAAIEAVTTGQTITLLKDVNENLSDVAKTFTLALEGRALGGTLGLADAGVISLDYGGGTLSSTVTGSGTIVYDATIVTAFPSAPTGLNAAGWTGTAEFRGYTFNGGQVLTDFGNAGSKVRMVKCAGYLPQNNPATFAFTLELANGDGEYGLSVNNGWSQGVKFAGLSGDGAFKMTKPSGQPTLQYIFTDSSRFRGSIEVNTSGTRMSAVLGDFTYSTSSDYYGKILVKGDVTVASGKTWTAVGGIQVDGTISGAGTLGSATTFGDTAMIVTAGGPLQATGGVTFGSALAVKGEVNDTVLSGLTAAPTLDNVTVTLKDPSTGETVPGDYELSYADGAIRVVAAAPATHFSAYVNGSGNWSALDWSPARPSTGFPADAEFVLTNNAASATVTFDENIDADLIKVASAAEKTLTLALGSGKAATVDAYDFTDAIGATTLEFAPGAATVAAGTDTILNEAGSGTLTIASGKKLTVKGGTVQETKMTNAGTLNFAGGTSASPIVYNADGGNGTNLGVFTLASGAYLKVTPNYNKIYNVTGADDGTSTLEFERASGTGTTNGSQFRKLTLVANVGPDGFWIERTNSFDATVDVVAQRGITLYGNDQTIGSLSGSGDIGKYGSQTRTLTITPSKDSAYSGASSHHFIIASSPYAQTLSGAFTGALTVNAGGKVTLGGTANPSGLTSSGLVTVPAGQLTHDVTLVAGATVNITGEAGQDEYVITTGAFTQGDGTVWLNGAALPSNYEVVENKIVKKQQSLLASRVALWNLDLQNDSVKGFCTMTAGSETTIADGKITTKKTSGASGSGYPGVKVDWTSGFEGKDMTVLVKYSGFSMNSGRTAMFSAIWGANASASETTVFETSGNSQIGLGTGVTSSTWTENSTKKSQSVPTAGLMLVTLSHSANKVKISYSTLTDSTYGAFSDPFSADYSVDGSFYGIKIGGTVGPYNHFYRPQMTVEGVVIFEGTFDKDSEELATFLSAFETEPTNYTAVVTGDVNFSALAWSPVLSKLGVQKGDSFTLTNTADSATVTFDHSVMVAGLAVTSDANKNLTITNGVGKSVAFSGPFDFTNANGRVTIGFSTGAANVVAGSDTVLTSVGSGTVTIGANKKATVPTTWTGTKSLAAQGTLVVTGGGTRNYDADMVANATVELAGDTAYTFSNASRLTVGGTLRITGTANTSSENESGMKGGTRLVVADNGRLTLNGRYVVGYGADSQAAMNIDVTGGELASADGYLFACGGYKNNTLNLAVSGGTFSAVLGPYANGSSGLAANRINIAVSGGVFAPTAIGTSNGTTVTPGGEATVAIPSDKGAQMTMTGGTFSVPAIVPSWLPITVTEGNATIGVQTGAANPVVRSVITVSGGKLNLPAGLAAANVTLSAGATLNITTNTPGQATYSITTGTFANDGTVQLGGVDLPTADYEVSGNQIVKKSGPTPTPTGAIHATVESAVNWSAIEWYNASEQKIGTITDFSQVTSAALTIGNAGVVTIDNWSTISGLAAKLTIGGAGKVAYTTSGTTTAYPTWTWKTGDDAWTGTYALSGYDGEAQNWNPTSYYNGTASKFEFGGTVKTKGWFWQSSSANNMFGELVLTGTINFTDGHTHPKDDNDPILHYCFTKLSGNGNITINTSSSATTALRFSDVSAYTGALSVDSTNGSGNGYRIFLGDGTLEASGENPTRVAIHVTGNATLGSATYAAKNGIFVHNPASVGGTATLASNATFDADAEIDVRGGNVLTANGTLTFGATTKVRVATAPTVGQSVKVISKSGTTAGPISTTVSVFVGTGDTPIAEPACTMEYKTDGVYLSAEPYKTLGWDASQSAWTNAQGVATAVDNTCILNAKAGDVITFASAVTPHQFNMPESGTVTLGTGGYLMNYAITVPSGAKLALGWDSSDAYSQIISGAGAVDITGAMVQLSANNTFTGALTVQNGGYLKMGANNCLNNSNTATVNAGGTLDINGKKELGALSFTLAGGALVNNGSNITHGEQQMASITLTDNSTIGGTGNFGLVTANYNATQLNLGTYTLTKTGSGTFWLCNTTIGGTGTLAIQEGTVDAHNDKTCTFADGTLLLISGGTFAANAGKAVTIPTLTVTSGTISGSGSISGLTTLKGSVDFSTFTGTITLANTVSIGTAGADETVTLGNASTEGKTLNVLGGTLNLAKDGVTRQVGSLTLDDGSTLMVSTNTTQAAVQVSGAVNLEGKNVAVAGVLPESGAKVYLLGATSITGTGTLVNPGAWTVALEDGNTKLTATKKPSTYITPGDEGEVTHASDVTDSLDISKELAKKVTKGTAIEVKDDSPAETVVEAMNQKGANNYKVWESAVLGLDPTNAASQLVISPIQGSSTTKVTLKVPTVNVDATTGADVTFCFWSKDGDGEWKEVSGGAVESGDEKELDLPAEGVKYYQLRTTIKTQAQKIPTVIPSANIVAAGAPVMTTPGTQRAASMGTKTLDAVSSSLTVDLAGAGVYEGQEYHLEVTEGASNSSSHFAIVAKATTNTTKHVTFYFGKEVPAGTTCKLTLLSANGAPNGNIVVETPGFKGVTYDNVMVTAMLANRPHLDDLGGMEDHTGYRIPAVATDGNGEVIACYDVRDYKSSGWTDLGHDTGIDVGESYSKDRGVSFNPPKRGINVPNCYSHEHPETPASYSKHTDMGDVCMVWDPSRKQYWILGMTGNGLAGSNTNLNDVVVYTRARGETSEWVAWHNPDLAGVSEPLDYRSIQHTVLSQIVSAGQSCGDGFLQGPGNAMVTKIGSKDGTTMPIGTVVFPVQYFMSKTCAGAIYLKPGEITTGNNWKATHPTGDDLSPQENCIMELDDGSWYMMCKRGNAYMAYRTTDYQNWVDVNDGLSNAKATEGSCLRIGVDKDGVGQYVFGHVNHPTTRRNLTLFFGHDTTAGETGTIPSTTNKGIEWDMANPLVIDSTDSGGMMYNSLCMLDDHTIGVLYEYKWHIYFTRIDVSDKVATPEK